ncbi:MAG: hypothetical protein IPP74_15525 [Alphaproteobacteria bacterium]|nr:hypothetical protein [Alphaproteobacteria bacterium]
MINRPKYNEQSVLDPLFRSKVISQIRATENKRRKNEAFKAYECFKDQTSRYVAQLLLNQFDNQTVLEMQYAMTNISFTRKIVDKLARVYANGVERTTEKKKDQKALDEMTYLLKLDAIMKEANRYLKLEKNVDLYVKPVPVQETGKYKLVVEALCPFLYDVIEDPNDSSVAMCHILSNFRPDSQNQYSLNPATEGRTSLSSTLFSIVPPRGDNVDDIISDSPTDSNPDQYIWWTNKYHFTTDAKGMIISEGEVTNPIGVSPFVGLSAEKYGSYWAPGGKDIIEAGIRINAVLTHINHISITQGYGQLTMIGKNLPKAIKTGPNHCIQLIQEEGEPTPSVSFLSANPPIGDLMKVVEAYVALLLSTNNLSTSGFSASLSGNASSFASGIAMMLDKSESMEDTKEQEQQFVEAEPKLWSIISKWQNLYKSLDLLTPEFQEVSLPLDLDPSVEFKPSQTIVSEKEKLEIIKIKQELGLITDLDAIKLDNPNLSDEAAVQKLEEIKAEKELKMQEFQEQNGGAVDENGNPIEDPSASGEAPKPFQKKPADEEQDA